MGRGAAKTNELEQEMLPITRLVGGSVQKNPELVLSKSEIGPVIRNVLAELTAYIEKRKKKDINPGFFKIVRETLTTPDLTQIKVSDAVNLKSQIRNCTDLFELFGLLVEEYLKNQEKEDSKEGVKKFIGKFITTSGYAECLENSLIQVVFEIKDQLGNQKLKNKKGMWENVEQKLIELNICNQASDVFRAINDRILSQVPGPLLMA